jgi:uncharacterized iron-regulated protein
MGVISPFPQNEIAFAHNRMRLNCSKYQREKLMKTAWTLAFALCFALQGTVLAASDISSSATAGCNAASKPRPPVLKLRICDNEGKEISFGVLVDNLMGSDFVCIGEKHDSKDDHAVQLQLIKALFARDESLGVGLEIFQRPFQSHLDRFIAGETDEQGLLEGSEYKTRWGHDWELYRAIASYCRRNGIPMAALNAPKELTIRVSKVGIENLTEEEKKELGTIDLSVKAHREQWFELLGKMHGHGTAQPSAAEGQKERSYQVMTIWDDYMAQSAANFRKARELRRMVILAGSGHVAGGFGIPDRVARYGEGKSATIGISTEGAPVNPTRLPTDYTIYVSP